MVGIGVVVPALLLFLFSLGKTSTDLIFLIAEGNLFDATIKVVWCELCVIFVPVL